MTSRDPELDDASLARRSRAGDVDAFAALVRRHQGVALRVAALLGPEEEAEDVCQEALLKAHRALGRYDPTRPFRPWLLAIVANEARSRGRARGRARRLLERAAALGPEGGEPADPGELALARLGSGALLGALAGLRADEQQTLALRLLLDLSVDETACVLGCRPGSVKSRTSRALARLRRSLEDAG